MTPSDLRSISRQLYAEPAQTFADCKPMVRPSNHVASYDRIQCAPTMTPTAHERSEWRRLASNAACRGFSGVCFNFSEAARMTEMPLPMFDALQAKYRAWLTFGTL